MLVLERNLSARGFRLRCTGSPPGMWLAVWNCICFCVLSNRAESLKNLLHLSLFLINSYMFMYVLYVGLHHRNFYLQRNANCSAVLICSSHSSILSNMGSQPSVREAVYSEEGLLCSLLGLPFWEADAQTPQRGCAGPAATCVPVLDPMHPPGTWLGNLGSGSADNEKWAVTGKHSSNETACSMTHLRAD